VTKPRAKLPKIPRVPEVAVPEVAAPGRPSRRQQYSAATKQSLVEVAEMLFTEHGYAATSLDAIVAGAEVTKGALYHHFSGKQAVFEAVFERVESRAAAEIHEATRGSEDPWENAQAGLRVFLDVVQQPAYQRVVIQDGPSVMGHERFREQEERSAYSNVVDIVHAALGAEAWAPDDPMLDTFARIFFGALSAAGGAVATSPDPAAAAARVEVAIGHILAGLQTLQAQGVELPRAATSPR
jgi:AcrR family transcriptional regulator